jgi:RNA polymerase sigma-70 factor (ECF subfamily)
MATMDSSDEPSLVARLRDGDTAAFDQVYDAYRARVFAFLLRMSRNRTVAEDLLDETWLRLVRHARLLKSDTRLGPWLFTVARNLYWTHVRASRVHQASATELIGLWPYSVTWPSPFDLAVADQLERRVEAALATLPAQHREVLLLVAYEGLSSGDAAAVCGIRPEAFRQRLSRARTSLAEKLDLTRTTAHRDRRFGT